MSKKPQNRGDDGDLWVERLALDPRTGKPRSFFQNVGTNKRFWDEPPTGASRVMNLDRMKKEEVEKNKKKKQNPFYDLDSTLSSRKMKKKDTFKPKKSYHVSKKLQNLEGDEDLWVERLALDPKTGKPRSFFQSLKTNRRLWDEPPTGASCFILRWEMRCLLDQRKEEEKEQETRRQKDLRRRKRQERNEDDYLHYDNIRVKKGNRHRNNNLRT